MQLERDVIEQARNGALTPKAGPSGLFATCDTGSAVHRNRRWATTTFDPDRRCSMTRRRIARRSPGVELRIETASVVLGYSRMLF